MKQLQDKIPENVTRVTETLQKAGFEAYLVGGCVRDMILGREPKDWDVTTNAVPEEIMSLFPRTFYENTFGTVGVVVNEENTVTRETPNEVSRETTKSTKNGEIETFETVSPKELSIIEVTPYRLEAEYSDSRHPDTVTFSKTLEDDLKRRDFTINALAFDPSKGEIVDLYKGQKDLSDKVIRAVGDPKERFSEDALRILRAVRFATELGFHVEQETEIALKELAPNLQKISAERIRDEFVKIIMSRSAMQGVISLRDYGLLQYIVPEMEKGIGMEQNKSHIYSVWEHNLRAMDHATLNNWPLHIRLAALFHDIGKPDARRRSEDDKDWTFYGHDVVGERMTKKIMQRLKFPAKTADTVAVLVRNHMFFSDVEQITLSAVRRIVANVGKENVWDLMKVRACDRIGMGRPKEKPYRLRKYESMIEEAMRAPVSVGMLKIDGLKVMEVTGEKPGPRLGFILHALLEDVLDDPSLNTAEYLEKRTLELAKLSDNDLKALGEEGKEKKAEAEQEELEKIRKKHGVK